MKAYHKEKLTEQIMHLGAEFIKNESNKDSLITVTDTTLSDDFKKATIFVTVLPDYKEQAVSDFLKRNRSDFKEFFKSKSKIGRVPQFDFQIDRGEKARQKVEEISQKI